MQTLLRPFIFALLLFAQLTKPIATVAQDVPSNEKHVTCFVYHRVGDHRYPSTNVSITDFEAHLNYLVENKYEVLSLSGAIQYLKSDAPVKNVAVITIDDGYKSFYKNGLPLLVKHKLPATIFINTQTIGAGDYMNWEQLAYALKNKVEIGNHTHSHRYFLDIKGDKRYQTFKEEIKQSQAIIKNKLSIVPTLFSYPYGEYDLKMKDIVKELGFMAATAQNSGVLDINSDMFSIPRFPMSESYSSMKSFKEKLVMKALKIISSSPSNTSAGVQAKPVLTLKLDATDIDIARCTCFVQGSACEMKVLSQTKSDLVVTLKSKEPITNRRRTLYTLTAHGRSGKWYWYSKLWVK